MKKDKLFHAIAGAVIYLLSMLLFWVFKIDWELKVKAGIAMFLVALAGFGKEYYDHHYKDSKMDEWDAVSTIVGGFLMLFVINLIF